MSDIIAILDIGSNSVRIALFSGGKIFLKRSINTQLGKGRVDNLLAEDSVLRTLKGAGELIELAKGYRAKKYFAFATAAVRGAKNKEMFISLFEEKFGIKVDVLSKEREALSGIAGALDYEDGVVIDVGGASTEVITRKEGKIVYSYSLDIGAVALTDLSGRDYKDALTYLKERIKEFSGAVSHKNAVAIGGSATTLAFMNSGLSCYDEKVTHGTVLKREKIKDFVDELYSLSPLMIAEKYHLKKERSEVIHSGALILLLVMDMLSLSKITVKESDNLEGYYALNLGDKND